MVGYKSRELLSKKAFSFSVPFSCFYHHHLFSFLTNMFFSASIALAFALSFSGIAVHSAPVAARADFVPQACTGPNGTGTCTPLNVAQPNTSGPAINPAACTNVDSPVSLILNEDNDCVSFNNPDCTIDFSNPNDFATEHFSDDSGNLAPGIKSISCEADPGFVNGLLAGFQG
ncbi:hypothetical protein B0H19DRAFT_1374790 [Mycena capillaripes]|nr:hypothetical protein B0H19DRAFT_1374790 [Mycena capillaripes]